MSRGKSGFLAVCFLAFIVVGAGLERVRQAVLAPVSVTGPLPEVPRQPEMPQARPMGAPGDNGASRGALDGLRRRVAELERELADREAELAKRNSPEAAAPRLPGREDNRQRLEQLKKDAPAQYEEKERRREEFRQRITRLEQPRHRFLASVDTRAMSDAQRENHEKLLATLAALDAVRAQREQAGAEPGSPADDVFREKMRQSLAELGPLCERERTYLLEQAAYASGYEGADAANFVAYIREAIQSTAPQIGPPGFGGGGVGSGGGGPRPGTP